MGDRHCSCFVRDLLEGMGEAEVCGVVVDLTPAQATHPGRPTTLELDDGTGVVRCALFSPPSARLSLGSALLVRGKVGSFRGQQQLTVHTVKLVTDPNFDTLWINKVIVENSVWKTTDEDDSLS